MVGGGRGVAGLCRVVFAARSLLVVGCCGEPCAGALCCCWGGVVWRVWCGALCVVTCRSWGGVVLCVCSLVACEGGAWSVARGLWSVYLLSPWLETCPCSGCVACAMRVRCLLLGPPSVRVCCAAVCVSSVWCV